MHYTTVFIRIGGFCVYNSIMVYFHVWRPEYKLIELKQDILTTLNDCHKELYLPLIRRLISDFTRESTNKSADLSSDFLNVNHSKEVKSWRVEYDENIHPVAINIPSKCDAKHSILVSSMMR